MSATPEAGSRLCNRTPARLTLAVLTLAALCPIDGQAQTRTTAVPANPWDTAVLAGALVGRPERSPGGYDESFETPQIAIVAGRHLTTHLKVEVEVSTSAEGRQFIQEAIPFPNSTFPIFVTSDRFTRVSAVQGALVWQFLENQWAHPFVQIGAVGAAERVRTRRWPQHLRVGSERGPTDVLIAGGQDGPTTATHVGLVVGTGAKFYVTPRLFIRADAQLSALPSATHAAFRAGLGMDF